MPNITGDAVMCGSVSRRCAEGVIHVWQANLGNESVRLPYYSSLLSEEEHRRAAQFLDAGQAARFVAGRGVVKDILSRYLGHDGGDINFTYGIRGKPALVSDGHAAPLYFNVAHSGDRLLLAVTRSGELGVDVEHLNARLDQAGLARRICTPRERALWRSLPPPQRLGSLMRYWTRKEAYLKATGLGLSQRLSELDVSGLQPRGLACDNRQQWHLHDLDVGGAYAAAIAHAGPPCPIRIHEWRGALAGRDELV